MVDIRLNPRSLLLRKAIVERRDLGQDMKRASELQRRIRDEIGEATGGTHIAVAATSLLLSRFLVVGLAAELEQRLRPMPLPDIIAALWSVIHDPPASLEEEVVVVNQDGKEVK
jgi:hypothetical protein